MAKTIRYTGALGPDKVITGGVSFAKGQLVVVEDDKLATAILKKKGFEPAGKKPLKPMEE
jgi:hypothetical protein